MLRKSASPTSAWHIQQGNEAGCQAFLSIRVAEENGKFLSLQPTLVFLINNLGKL